METSSLPAVLQHETLDPHSSRDGSGEKGGPHHVTSTKGSPRTEEEECRKGACLAMEQLKE